MRKILILSTFSFLALNVLPQKTIQEWAQLDDKKFTKGFFTEAACT
jgi:hypothetical protein